jgi:phospholipid transport system substrate-binding protein
MMRFALAFSLLFSLFAYAPIAHADDAKQASAFVDKVVSQSMSTIKDKQAGKLSEDSAKTNFRKILNDAFDVPTIAKFTLGRYWRVATPAQQKEFTGLLQTVILDKYADRVLSYSGNGYKIISTTPMDNKDYTVSTAINRENDAPVAFDWRVRTIDGKLKVIDISVEGISMSVTHRSDFASEIERNGGQVQALIDALKTQGDVSSDKK